MDGYTNSFWGIWKKITIWYGSYKVFVHGCVGELLKLVSKYG